jgi:hypothetical protein
MLLLSAFGVPGNQPERSTTCANLQTLSSSLRLPRACDDGPVTGSYPFFLLACRVSRPFAIHRSKSQSRVRA